MYGSHNSNLPSMYEETYTRIHRSNGTTTHADRPAFIFHTAASPKATFTRKSNSPSDEAVQYSLDNAIFQGPSLQDVYASDSKLCQKHDSKQTTKTHSKRDRIRRVQSDSSLFLVKQELLHSSGINNHRANRKSKSMVDSLHQTVSINQQEPASIEEKQKPTVERKSVRMDLHAQ